MPSALTAAERTKLERQLSFAREDVAGITAELEAGKPATPERLDQLVDAHREVALGSYLLEPCDPAAATSCDALCEIVVRLVEAGGHLTPGARTRYVAVAAFRQHSARGTIAGYDRETISDPDYDIGASAYDVDAALVAVLTGGGDVAALAAAQTAIGSDNDAPAGWALQAQAHLALATAIVNGDAAAAAAAVQALGEVFARTGGGLRVDLTETGLVAAARQRGLDIPLGPEPLIAEGLMR